MDRRKDERRNGDMIQRGRLVKKGNEKKKKQRKLDFNSLTANSML
jgi:hypothetical protein